MANPIITLTTDFGLRDGFVGVMKGVILGVCPEAVLVDISHDVPPQDVHYGAFVLGTSWPYFPRDTVHLAVVDPGVGTSRHALLLVTPEASFVAPDNGLLSYVLMDHGVRTDGEDVMRPVKVAVPEGCRAYRLSREEVWLRPVSRTFHGRDIFSPAAAHLAAGSPPEALGEPVSEVTCLNMPAPAWQGDVVEGHVVFIDHFGNLITNIPGGDVEGSRVQVDVCGRRISGLSGSYAESDGLLALIGSHGRLEVALNQGNAAEMLEASVGNRVWVRLSAGRLDRGRARGAYG